MRLIRYSLVFLTVVLVSCETTTNFSSKRLDVDGEYIQLSSGQVFPESIGNFTRSSLISYAPDDSDIGANYNHQSLPIIVSFYVYPAPELQILGGPLGVVESERYNLFMGAYKHSVLEIVYSHEDQELISEQDFTLEQSGNEYVGKHANFNYSENFAGQSQMLSSHLYLFQVGDVLYKYRISHPVNFFSENEIHSFMDNMIINPRM